VPRTVSTNRHEGSQTARLEGINYFADTLLFAGTILALAGASPGSD
jgi:hypothetical protein